MLNLTAYLRAIFPQLPLLTLTSSYVNRNSRIVTTGDTQAHTHIYFMHTIGAQPTRTRMYLRTWFRATTGFARKLVALISVRWSCDFPVSGSRLLIKRKIAPSSRSNPVEPVSDLLITDTRFPKLGPFRNERSTLYIACQKTARSWGKHAGI